MNYWTKHRNTGTTSRCRTCCSILDAMEANDIARVTAGGDIDADALTDAIYGLFGESVEYSHYRYNILNIIGANAERQGFYAIGVKREKPTLDMALGAHTDGVDGALLARFTEDEEITVPADARKASHGMISRLITKAREAYLANDETMAWHLVREASRRHRAAMV